MINIRVWSNVEQSRYNVEIGSNGKQEGGADGHTAQMRRAPANLHQCAVQRSEMNAELTCFQSKCFLRSVKNRLSACGDKTVRFASL